MLWIPVTVLAAFAQTGRFMLQRHLKVSRLSTGGATLARFLYSAPLVALLVAGYLAATGQALPPMSGTFWTAALIGGAGQLLATLCVVALFAHRSFAIGITFKNTEVVLTAITGFLVLGEAVSYQTIGKPDAHMARLALQRAGIDPAEAIFVGDNPGTDGGIARNAGIPFVHLVREHAR